jgi:hypothetical protein
MAAWIPTVHALLFWEANPYLESGSELSTYMILHDDPYALIGDEPSARGNVGPGC